MDLAKLKNMVGKREVLLVAGALAVFAVIIGIAVIWPTQHQQERVYLPELIKETSMKIEGDLWAALGAGNESEYFAFKILIVTDGTGKYNDTLKDFEEYMKENGVSVVKMNYSEMNESVKQALWRVLALYGLPEDLPIIVAVKPPVVYISCGGETPLPDVPMLYYLEKYHPMNFFDAKGTRVAIMAKDANVEELKQLVDMLDKKGIETAVYYKVDVFGFASARVLDVALDREDSYVVIAEDGYLKEVLPLDKAYRKLQNLPAATEAANTEPAATEIINVESENVSVYFFYSPTCPHCEEVMPYVKELAKTGKAKFTFCDVTGEMSNECVALIKEIGIDGVPTAVVKAENKTRVLVGSDEVRMLGALLGASR